MAGALKHPLLEHRSSSVVALNRAKEAHAASSSAANDRCPERHCSLRLGYDLVSIHRIDRLVAIAMKYNGRHCCFAQVRRSFGCASAIAHCREGGRNVAR